MILNKNSISSIINYSNRGVRYLLNRIGVPFKIIKHKIYINTEDEHPFCKSIEIIKNNPKFKVFYTIPEIAKSYSKDCKTVLGIIVNETNIKLYGKHKKFVFISDLLVLGEQMGKKSVK